MSDIPKIEDLGKNAPEYRMCDCCLTCMMSKVGGSKFIKAEGTMTDRTIQVIYCNEYKIYVQPYFVCDEGDF